MNSRYYSLDVFRGATVCLMILVNNPGSWSYIYSPLEHAPWHGVTPTDLVFPFFLFAVGNAMAFVMPRLEAGGQAAFWRKIVKRTGLIFGIGLFLQWWPFLQWQDGRLIAKGWEWVDAAGSLKGVRVMGVLQRIALCYFFAAIIIYYLKLRGAFLAGLLILLIYWLLCYAGPPVDPYSLEGWPGTKIDLAVFGEPHLYHGEQLNGKPYAFDPEGLASTLPAIAQVIFGFITGDYIRKRGAQVQMIEESPAVMGLMLYQTLAVLFVAAVALLFTGYAWGLSFPINKKIWTSSYVVYTSGLAVVVLTTLVYAIEVRKMTGWWTWFFDVFGKNALFIFALSSFLYKTLTLIRIPDGLNKAGQPQYTNPWSWWYQKVCIHVPGRPENGSLLFALSVIFVFWAICYWLDQKKIYIKV